MKILLEPGDCFSIPLSDGSFAFGQYVLSHPSLGPLVRIFDIRSKREEVQVTDLMTAGLAFPPIFVGLNPPIRMKRWRKIATFPVDNFEFPKFRSSVSLKKGTNSDWRIWDGNSFKDIGLLPPNFRDLEIRGMRAYQDVEERILTGRDWVSEGRE